LSRLHPPGPDFIIEPELLFPYDSPKPDDIEIIEEVYDDSCRLDMERIENILRKLLIKPNRVPTFYDFVTTQLGTSRALSVDTIFELISKSKRGEKVTDYKYAIIPNWFDRGHHDGADFALRRAVWTGTTKYRDAIILPPHTLYKVWLFNQQLKFMMKGTWVGDSSTVSDLEKFKGACMMTDWKKSGLTMPHWFIKVLKKIMLEYGVQSDFPDDGWPIYDAVQDKIIYPTQHGYGLGMVNNAYTIFNVMLFEYAKGDDIVSQEDKILSFNDDSVFTCENFVYHQWIRILEKSGGFLDEYKTFRSSAGALFCERHLFEKFRSGFKWTLMYNTLCNSALYAVTRSHARYWISDVYRISSSIYQYRGDRTFTASALSACVTDIFGVAELLWGELSNEVPPELGGLSLGVTHRTKSGLKSGLILLEQLDLPREYVNELIAAKIYNSTPLIFRPWVKFPQGKLYRYLREIAKIPSFNGETESISRAIRSQFSVDSAWFLKEYWNGYEKAILTPHPCEVLWDFVRENNWFGYAIPNSIVDHSIEWPFEWPIVFVGAKVPSNRYSTITNILDFLNLRDNNIADFISYSDVAINLGGDVDVPLMPFESGYKPCADMTFIAAIRQYAEPRVALYDYAVRNNRLITCLKQKSSIETEALEIWCSLFKKKPESYVGATWYTRMPMPYTEITQKELIDVPVIYHESYLGMIFTHPNEDVEYIRDPRFASITSDIIERNKQFLERKNKSSRKQERRKERKKPSGALTSADLPSVPILSEFRDLEISERWNLVSGLNFVSEEPQTEEFAKFGELAAELPDVDFNAKEEEEEPHPEEDEANPEDDEDELARVLDMISRDPDYFAEAREGAEGPEDPFGSFSGT
jgi:hypothetical protein